MTARDVTGFCAFFSARESGNFLHVLGGDFLLNYTENLEKKNEKMHWRKLKKKPVETAPRNCRNPCRGRTRPDILGALGEFRGILRTALGIRQVLNPTPATCHKRETEVTLQFSLRKLHCGICFSAVRTAFFFIKNCAATNKNCTATLKKLRCRKVALSCRFPADFKLPCLGSHV